MRALLVVLLLIGALALADVTGPEDPCGRFERESDVAECRRAEARMYR